MKNIFYIIIFSLFYSGVIAQKPSLCTGSEENVYSFVVKSKKVVSVCMDKGSKYIVYRFGLPGKIELQYPELLDQSSWSKFEYYGLHRGGGPENAAMSMQYLTFENNGVNYQVNEQNGYDDDMEESYSEFSDITVTVNGKDYKSKADMSTANGSLQRLDGNVNIKNTFYAE